MTNLVNYPGKSACRTSLLTAGPKDDLLSRISRSRAWTLGDEPPSPRMPEAFSDAQSENKSRTELKLTRSIGRSRDLTEACHHGGIGLCLRVPEY
jgi:hypothetical protein